MERKFITVKVKGIHRTKRYGVTRIMVQCIGRVITGYFEQDDIFRQCDARGYSYAWHPDDLEFKCQSFKERIK